MIKKHHISFKNAISGLYWALTTQPNFRVHLCLSAVAIALGMYVSLSYTEWVIIILTIVWGLAGEMTNTAIEAAIDLITSEWKQEAKIAKDVSAGMMLIIALGAILVASLIIIPKLVIKFI